MGNSITVYVNIDIGIFLLANEHATIVGSMLISMLSLDMVTLKSSNDSYMPLGVVSGLSISNFRLGNTLFTTWWKWFAVSSLVFWK